ncbi:beta-phosphoglucomutase [Ornithinibacillus bavariensis]|uniref:Beta-phosphoglucomutase n=1 Tax=Ornithinibacillus bavariensis TaxID=545502 RepID=A0A919XDW3_9BACI|nr:beta-phosphoglucomutase [Ornithinibacillus bavariensis]GIO28698.1 beta-phosphoglucomutase [Ornithinibacillus bavariensis]
MIKAFIFDLDGVITDTAELHYQAWKRCAEKLNITIDSKFNERLKGVGRMESLELILEHGGKQNHFTEKEKRIVAEEKNEYYRSLLIENQSLEMLPNMHTLLLDIKHSGYKLALASASRNAPLILQALGITQLFDSLADPSIVKGKPAPDLFLQAAALLKVETQECIAIEDAQSGIEAINRAGMFAVGVGEVTYLKQADYVVPTTKELSLNEILVRWWEKEYN